MRVCLVQLEVAYKEEEIGERLARITALITSNKLEPGRTDLILLPETAFSNYCFTDAEQAAEKAKDESEVLQWAAAIAVQYKCYLAFGLVSSNSRTKLPRNVLKLVDREGKVCHEQMKRFLYYSDLKWTQEHAQEFVCVKLQTLQGTSIRAMFAICNDINAAQYSEMNQYALAKAALEANCQVLFLSAAWCSAHPQSPTRAHNAPITQIGQLEYWYERLLPLLGSKCHFCVADLVGREQLDLYGKRIRYCGTSCCIDLETCKVLSVASTNREEVMLVEFL